MDELFKDDLYILTKYQGQVQYVLNQPISQDAAREIYSQDNEHDDVVDVEKLHRKTSLLSSAKKFRDRLDEFIQDDILKTAKMEAEEDDDDSFWMYGEEEETEETGESSSLLDSLVPPQTSSDTTSKRAKKKTKRERKREKRADRIDQEGDYFFDLSQLGRLRNCTLERLLPKSGETVIADQSIKSSRAHYFSQFHSLLNNPLLHDVVIRVIDKEEDTVQTIFAHKLILRLRSEHFHQLFSEIELKQASDTEPAAKTASSDICSIDITNVQYDILMRVLEFVYTGQVRVTPQSIMSILSCASKFQVQGIHELLSKYFKSHIDEETVCYLLEEANRFNSNALFRTCLQYVNRNANRIFFSKSFHLLSKETLIRVLKSRGLELEEHVVFEAVVQWAKEKEKQLQQQHVLKQKHVEEIDEEVDEIQPQKEEETFEYLIRELCPYIQFGVMSPSDLRDLVELKYPGLVPSSYLLAAYKYIATGEGFDDQQVGRFMNCFFKWDSNFKGPQIQIDLSGDIVHKQTGGTQAQTVLGNLELRNNRRYYFAIKVLDAPASSYSMIGVTDRKTVNTSDFLSHNARGYAIYLVNGQKYSNRQSTSYSTAIHKGDEVGVLVDLGKKTINFFKNGIDLGVAYTNITGPLYPAVTVYSTEKFQILKNARFNKPKK